MILPTRQDPIKLNSPKIETTNIHSELRTRTVVPYDSRGVPYALASQGDTCTYLGREERPVVKHDTCS